MIEGEKWPLKIVRNKRELKKTLRPVIRFEENKILEDNINWGEKELKLKDLYKRDFKNYIEGLDEKRVNDTKAFYGIVNSICKYKCKQILIKGITDEANDKICGDEAAERIARYLRMKFDGDNGRLDINDDDVPIDIDLEFAFRRLSANKA